MGLLNKINQSLVDARQQFRRKKNVFGAPQGRLIVRNLKTYLDGSTQDGKTPEDPQTGTQKTLYANFSGSTKYVSRSASQLKYGGLRSLVDSRRNRETRFACDLIEACTWLMNFDDSGELREAVKHLHAQRNFHEGKFVDMPKFNRPLAVVAAAEGRVQQLFEANLSRMKAVRQKLMVCDPSRLAKVKDRRRDIEDTKILNTVWEESIGAGPKAAYQALEKLIEKVAEMDDQTPIQTIEDLLMNSSVAHGLNPQAFDALIALYESLTLDRVRT